MKPFNVDDLAQEIRRVDGNHSMGAGVLAEALMPFLASPPLPQQGGKQTATTDDAVNAFREYARGEHWEGLAPGRQHEEGFYAGWDAHKSIKGEAAVLPQGGEQTDLTPLYDLFGIGSQVRALDVLLTNVSNAKRRSDCLWAIEHEFFMKTVPDEDSDIEGETMEVCDLNWGSDRAEYVEQFRKELAAVLRQPNYRHLLARCGGPKGGCPDCAVLPQVGEAKPEPTLPEMPPSVFKHPTLGSMWDRLEMHFYAKKHADAMVNLLSAVPDARAGLGETN